MSSNGDEILAERQRQRDHEQEQRNLQQAFQGFGSRDASFVRELLNSDDITQGSAEDLDEVTVGKLENMLSRQWILSNLTEAQEHDARYKLEVMKYKILGMHPRGESVVSGPARAYLLDDPMEELQPLTPHERVLVDELIETLKTVVTRGREGFERRQINTRVAQTRTENERTNNDKSGWRSLFG